MNTVDTLIASLAASPASRRMRRCTPNTVRTVAITLGGDHPFWSASSLERATAVSFVEAFFALTWTL